MHKACKGYPDYLKKKQEQKSWWDVIMIVDNYGHYLVNNYVNYLVDNYVNCLVDNYVNYCCCFHFVLSFNPEENKKCNKLIHY